MKKILFVALFSVVFIFTTAQTINSLTGPGNGYGGDGGAAISAQMSLMQGPVIKDASGNIYIPDMNNQRIRKIDALTGIITTVAGTGSPGFNGDGITAISAQLNYPSCVAIDTAGNLYIGEYSGCKIRKVDATTGLISTILGNGSYGYNGNDIVASSATSKEIGSILIGDSGNIYYTDMGNHIIRKISASNGIVHTIAGSAGIQGFSGDGGIATAASLDQPYGITRTASGDIYIADRSNYRIRKVDGITGIITTVAGDGTSSYNGDGILATTASLNAPWGVAVDASGNLYIADTDHFRIRKVSTSDTITTISGNGNGSSSGDGGPAILAEVGRPFGIYVDDCGAIYFASYGGDCAIRKISGYEVPVNYSNVKCHNACDGTVSASATGGSGSYTYVWDGGLGAGPTKTNLCNGTYRLLVTDGNNCYEERYITITQPAVLSATISPVPAICLTPGSASVSVSGGTIPYSYLWSVGGTSATHAGLVAGNYTVTVTDTNSCVATKTVTISNNPSTINIPINTTNATCFGNGSATAVPSGGTMPYEYSWSTGDTVATISSLSAGNYSVTIIDVNGCVGTQTVNVINNPYPSAPICMVTVDSASHYNIIMWDKSSLANIDTFIVLREIASNNYQSIANIPYDSLSQFIDTVRTKYFPNTGDPNAGTYRYKIKMIDTCGIPSLVSPYHNTIYFLNNNGTFYWTQPYSIENAANPVSSYILLRDANSNGNWQQVTSVAGTQQVISDPLYNIYQNTATWRVQTQWSISCTPTAKMANGTQSAFSSSYSNTYTNIGIGVKSNIENKISLYPNPSTGSFTIETGSLKNSRVEIYSLLGNLVYKADLKKEKNLIATENLSKGTYLVYILSDGNKTVKKMVIE